MATRFLPIHSDDRTNSGGSEISTDLGTNSIKVEFPQGAVTADVAVLQRVGVRTFTMANQIYNVSSALHPRKGYMNLITLTNGTFTFTGTVPTGQYSVSDLITSLNGGGSSPTVWTGTAGEQPTFSQNAVTRIVSVTIVGGPNAGAAFRLGYMSVPTSTTRSWIGHLLGFHNYNCNTLATTQTAIRQPNMIPFQHIYLALVGMRSAILPAADAYSANSAAAIACIPINVPYGELIVYTNDHPPMLDTNGSISLSTGLYLALVDDEGTLLMNNSAKWECTLEGEFAPSTSSTDPPAPPPMLPNPLLQRRGWGLK